MKIKLGIVMDPICSINIKKDSSFAILLEAQKRKYSIYYMELLDLYLENNKPFAKAKLLTLKNNIKKWFFFKKEKNISLLNLDIILMRKDPPINEQYIYITYILEQAENQGVLVINKPKSLRNFNEKLFTIWFPNLIPKTLITSNISKIHNFLQKYEDIIIKPLNGMGGFSIFRIKKNDPNTMVIIETMTNHGKKLCISQIYLPEIKNGDKRILVINGKPFPWCLSRIPKINENRGNLAVGGTGKVKKLTRYDWNIANFVSKTLKKNGLYFVGLDVIGNKLTEINITSPTCINEIQSKCKISISNIILNSIEKRLLKNSS
ncbi:glutathione synthetase [Buchnera aphidicola (Schlechtendalia chinensis)]|uniref:Glutathione synthetase n=1 Tax=Buchnera aphidicola subsp. Schlechtendalia chinensis TaxID=118110 RepID=A0A172WE39_BUCSC|nr:glutathione synthase [Buchnera aphidicola]ANF17246.1 glutathione synthetase [Buchnera aphidicola (Schlechtendalia chinensis)]